MFSVYFCSREAIRRIDGARGKGGVIVNMSSVAARLGGLSGGAGYPASKGAIDSFNIAVAREVGAARMEEMAKTLVPLGRAGSAAEVTEVALWLSSDSASYVHSTVVDVAGGK